LFIVLFIGALHAQELMASEDVMFLQNEPEIIAQLKGWESQASIQVKATIAKLRDGSAVDKAYAAEAIQKFESVETKKAAILALLNLLHDTTPLDVYQKNGLFLPKNTTPSELAAQTLVWIGRPAVDGLAAALNDRSESVREKAATCLSSIFTTISSRASFPEEMKGGTYKKATAASIKALRDKNPLVRQSAASALGDINDCMAVPALMETLLKDEGFGGFFVRQEAAAALRKLRDPRSKDALRIAALQDTDEKVRAIARHALSIIDPHFILSK